MEEDRRWPGWEESFTRRNRMDDEKKVLVYYSPLYWELCPEMIEDPKTMKV